VADHSLDMKRKTKAIVQAVGDLSV
jgi:hypothetical protein